MSGRRSAFFVSDRTGITAEMLGHSLLIQFDAVAFRETTLPYVDTPEKAHAAVATINRAGQLDGVRPLVFATLMDAELNHIVSTADACHLDCLHHFLAPLEAELGTPATRAMGRSHSLHHMPDYHERIEAVNYALIHDDGASVRELAAADLILVGVSRCGKTPTCLYLALQYGIRAANYPLVEEDFKSAQLPEKLRPLKAKLFGLTIEATRLSHIRAARKPDSRYATLHHCRFEVHAAEALMRQHGIEYLDTSDKSVEEIATTVLHRTGLDRKIY
ncbi:MAG: pyruvate, water dikinase regulatory protein [Pseudomonadota bacterium]